LFKKKGEKILKFKIALKGNRLKFLNLKNPLKAQLGTLPKGDLGGPILQGPPLPPKKGEALHLPLLELILWKLNRDLFSEL